MIKFNELRILPDSKRMIIDVYIPDLNYYENVYIDEVYIDTQNTYVEGGPSSNTIYHYTSPSNSTYKTLRLDLDELDLQNTQLSSNMFIVYVVAKGAPSSDVPCGEDNATTVAVVVDMYAIFKRAMCTFKELANTCDIPQNFVNSILQFKAFEMSVLMGQYQEAIKFWSKFFANKRTHDYKNNCGCYGSN